MKNNTTFIKALSLSCLILSVEETTAATEEKSPNFVLIIADQWRATALGYRGIEPVQTPHIDRWATEGVAFHQAVSSYPVSSPARAMLMTGQYPIGNKVVGNCNSRTTPYNVELQENALCWSDVLKREGYRMGYIGKWHLDSPVAPYVDCANNRGEIAWNEWCAPERRHGFDYWYAYGTYDNHLKPLYWNTNALREGFHYVNQWGPEHEVDKAIDFIKKDKNDDPFALVVSINPPHTGYNLVPDRYKALYKEMDIERACKKPSIEKAGTKWGNYYRKNVRDYYACITGVDEQIGRLIAFLKSEGLYNNTIIVFSSDHGDCMGAHGQVTKNNYYEDAMAVPMIVSWPQKIKPRIDSTTLISFQDIYPTVLSLLGKKKQIPTQVETFDLSKQVVGQKGVSPKFQPYYKIDETNHLTGWRGVRTLVYTFALRFENGKIVETVLFNRNDDPHQMTNIAQKQPLIITDLKKTMKDFLLQTNDPISQYL